VRPTVEFFGIGRLVADITEVRHDACEPGVESCAPVAPHPEDSVLVVLDMDGFALGEGLTLSIGTERKHVAALAAQLETVARQLREVSGSWKRIGVCVTCGLHGFDAENPPPVWRCPSCSDTRFELVDAATESRSAASGCGCGVHDILRRVHAGHYVDPYYAPGLHADIQKAVRS